MKRKISFVCLTLLFLIASVLSCSCSKIEIIIRKETSGDKIASQEEADDEREVSERTEEESPSENDLETREDTQAEQDSGENGSAAPEPETESERETESVPNTPETKASDNPETASEAPSESSDSEPASESPEESSEEPASPYIHYESGRVGNSIHTGDIVVLGSFEQDNERMDGPEPLEWLVIREEPGRLLLISVYSLNNLPYDEDHELSIWADCSLNKWLNGNFYESCFSEAEKEFISYVEMRDGYPSAAQSSLSGGWVFCLSKNDLEGDYVTLPDRRALNSPYADVIMKRAMLSSEYYPNTVEEVDQKREEWNRNYGTGCSWWWLRDPAGWFVHATGEVKEGTNCRDLNSVRPAMWVVR